MSNYLHKDTKIYVAGHNGLVGRAMMRLLHAQGYQQIITRDHSALDLTQQAQVNDFFLQEKPDVVILAAAKVGGILANYQYPAEFIQQNCAIEMNVIHAAWQNQVSRLIFLGSSCIYPKNCPQPIREDYLLTGELEFTNRPYAIAKIAGIEMCWAYNRQYQTQYLALMPTNLYGPDDNFDLQTSHVIPALIRKVHEAKINNQPSVQAWGSGRVYREFLYVDDLADACLFLLNQDKETFTGLTSHTQQPPILNIGTGIDLTIKELLNEIKQVIGYSGEVVWDATKPDGTPKKLLDITQISNLGWHAKTALKEGLKKTYESIL
jgi:GDP-L-fucose synthase